MIFGNLNSQVYQWIKVHLRKGNLMKQMTFIAVAVVCGLLSFADPAFAEEKRVEFTNYPQYGKAPPPEYRVLIQPIVEEVVRVVKDGGTASLRILGHADFDAQGDAFVTKVSVERASSAQQTLMSAIMLRAELEGITREQLLNKVNVTLEGLGTMKALYAANRPMSDRVKNRRVEIFWETATPNRPLPRRPRPAPSPIPTAFKVAAFGIWNKSNTVRVVGDQLVRFVLTNSNPLLGTTITIESESSRDKKSRIIPPLGTVEIEFSMLTPRPIEWIFHVSTDSDSFVVTWSALTHVPIQ